MDIEKYLPRCRQRSLRCAIIGVTVLFLGFTIVLFLGSASLLTKVALAALLILSAVGLWRLVSWARRVAMTLLILTVLILLGAFASPMGADDMVRAGHNPWVIFFLIVYPVIFLALLAIYALGKNKDEFRKRAFL